MSPEGRIAGLEAEWRALEPLCPSLSFFQSWTWMGCLAAERFPDPVVLRAAGGLALCSLRGGRLSLGEAGDPALDSPFIEDNGPLATSPEALAAVLEAAWKGRGVRRLVLSGVPEPVLAAARGVVLRRQDRPAPFVDIAPIRAAGGSFLDSLSANSRQQLRRAMRASAATGPLRLDRAASEPEAEEFLAELIRLHQADWQGRGKPGAFAHPFMRRFHAELVRRALPRGELDLLRLSAGPRVLGYLYNFRHRGRVYAYQAGFDRAAAGPQEKPGLAAHALAIEAALAEGAAAYDFLGGAARYKESLANATRTLVWAELARPGSLAGLLARFRRPAAR